jgi:hypothetical protein
MQCFVVTLHETGLIGHVWIRLGSTVYSNVLVPMVVLWCREVLAVYKAFTEHWRISDHNEYIMENKQTYSIFVVLHNVYKKIQNVH